MKDIILDEINFRQREIMSLLLWQNKAIKINDEPPYFQLASKNYSPIYIDCRVAISFPEMMHYFVASVKNIISTQNICADIIAGGETAGIPFASFIAQSLSIPMIYIRKKTKEHGTASRIEGVIRRGDKVLLIEDLITDAKSKIGFIDAVKAESGIVEHTLVLFDREQGGRELLENIQIKLHSVTNFSTALGLGAKLKLITQKEYDSAKSYHSSPEAWHNSRGLEYKKG